MSYTSGDDRISITRSIPRTQRPIPNSSRSFTYQTAFDRKIGIGGQASAHAEPGGVTPCHGFSAAVAIGYYGH